MGVAGAIVGGAALGVGGSMLAAGTQADAAQNAAQTQADAANQAGARSMAQYQQTRSDLQPFVQMGYDAQSRLQNGIDNGFYATPDFQAPTSQADLAATPGYQFTLNQGLKATQNSAAARGLGISGAAMKGAAGYATGLADQTYGNQFNRALATYTANIQGKDANYNRLMGMIQSGQNAAAMVGNNGAQMMNSANNYLTGGAAASAAGTMGAANAYANGINGATGGLNSGVMNYALMNGLGMFGGGGGSYGSWLSGNASNMNALGMSPGQYLNSL